jgi:hypothetical protein
LRPNNESFVLKKKKKAGTKPKAGNAVKTRIAHQNAQKVIT